MQLSSVDELEKTLKTAPSSSFPRLIALISQDPLQREIAEKALLEFCRKLQVALGAELTFITEDKLEEELFSHSLFTKLDIKILRVEDDLSKEQQPLLESFVKTPHSTTMLVLIYGSKPKIQLKGPSIITIEIPALKPWEKQGKLQDYIQKTLSAIGKKLHSQGVQELAKDFQDDALSLEEELQKLITYTASKRASEITYEECQAICTLTAKTTLWQLMDALLEKSVAKALQAYQHLKNEETHALQLLRFLRNQFHTLIELQAHVHKMTDRTELARLFPQMKGKFLDKNIQIVQGKTEAMLKSTLLLIDELELKLKNSQVNEELAVELLLIKLSS